jgi:hypothetical protein
MAAAPVDGASTIFHWLACLVAPAVLPQRLSSAVLVVYALALALVLGLGSAYWAIGGTYPLGDAQVGPWRTWPRIGSRDVDPYALSVMARTADIPLGTGEGLALTATRDDEDGPLRDSCSYRVGSVTPQARYWTLTVYDAAGRAIATDLGRSGFTSAELLREPDGRFAIVLSREAAAGNWIKLPPVGRFRLVLRLYDTPVAAGVAALDPRALPSIERLGCNA